MFCSVFFFFQAEDGIRDLVRSRGLGDVYKRQGFSLPLSTPGGVVRQETPIWWPVHKLGIPIDEQSLSLIHI